MSLASYKAELIERAMEVGALKFGSFTLKSGRISPYFFNAGLMSTGPILATLGAAYAHTIVSALPAPDAFDVLFGPAYKGIPFGAVAAVALSTAHARDVGFAYDRKEAKDHGEGGALVGVPLKGKRVLVLDDVMTAGTAVRGAMEKVRTAGGTVVGVVQCLDREEVGREGGSTVQEVEGLLEGGKVCSILKMRDLIAWLEANGRREDVLKMKEYWDQYGIKD